MHAIVIGASSGGPKALEEILITLPENFDAYVFVIQHLPILFTGTMAQRLNTRTAIPTSQMINGELLTPRHIYIVPGDFHFFLTAPSFQVSLLRATGLTHPSINMGFTSVAEHFGPKTIGVVLTGMGDDGVIGAQAIRQVHGRVLVQDEETSAIYGMPKAVRDAGFADEVLPLEGIAARLVTLVRGSGTITA